MAYIAETQIHTHSVVNKCGQTQDTNSSAIQHLILVLQGRGGKSDSFWVLSQCVTQNPSHWNTIMKHSLIFSCGLTIS